MQKTKTIVRDYRDLIVWQKGMDLVVAVYEVTSTFPKDELFGLSAQMRRAAASVPSNIAEGYRRGTTKDYRHFLLIAFGSASELGTQLEIAVRVRLVSNEDITKCMALLDEVVKMLNTMTRALRD